MDMKSFSADSVVTVQGIGREWAMPGRHGPPFAQAVQGPCTGTTTGAGPPDRHEHPPSEERRRRPAEGSRRPERGVRDHGMKKLPRRKKIPS